MNCVQKPSNYSNGDNEDEGHCFRCASGENPDCTKGGRSVAIITVLGLWKDVCVKSRKFKGQRGKMCEGAVWGYYVNNCHSRLVKDNFACMSGILAPCFGAMQKLITSYLSILQLAADPIVTEGLHQNCQFRRQA